MAKSITKHWCNRCERYLYELEHAFNFSDHSEDFARWYIEWRKKELADYDRDHGISTNERPEVK